MLDTRGHHCCQCAAGGDRTIRHNKLRNEVFVFCREEAGIHHAELEKPDLLLPARSYDEQQAARRPADIYLPTHHCWHCRP